MAAPFCYAAREEAARQMSGWREKRAARRDADASEMRGWTSQDDGKRPLISSAFDEGELSTSEKKGVNEILRRRRLAGDQAAAALEARRARKMRGSE